MMDEDVLTRSEQKLSISKAGVEQVVPPSPAFALLPTPPPSLPPLVLILKPWTLIVLQTLGTWQPHEAGNSIGGWDLDSPRRASKQPRSMFNVRDMTYGN